MGQGPILDVIDAGHFARTPEKGKTITCSACRAQWPCRTMVDARKAQVKYAENLRRNALVARETRRTYV